MKNVIELQIIEVGSYTIKAICGSEVKEFNNAVFLNKNLLVGQTRYLAYDSKNNSYSEFSLIFNNEYKAKFFKAGIVYPVVQIQSTRSGMTIFQTIDGFYGRIYEGELISEKGQGEVFSVSLNRYNTFSEYEANKVSYCNALDNTPGNYSIGIKNVNLLKTDNFMSYEFMTEHNFKISVREVDEFLLQTNVDFFKSKIEDGLILNCYLDRRSNLIIDLIKNIDLETRNYGLLINKNGKYYAETNMGIHPLYVDNLSYIEKKVLLGFENNLITYSIFRERIMKNEKQRTYKNHLVLKEYSEGEIQSLVDKDLENLSILQRIETTVDKSIFVLKDKEALMVFAELRDLSYGNEIFDVDYIFDKLKISHILGNRFIMMTRKPFLIDPRDEFFSSKKTGDIIHAKVINDYKNYLSILINDEFEVSIIKEKLKPYKFFEISEFYRKGEIHQFIVQRIGETAELYGYDLREYEQKKSSLIVGQNYNGYIYKQMITKYIVRINDVETELPIDEISYHDGEEKFDDTIYNFKILSNEKGNIIISKKRLSDIYYAFLRNYNVGDKIKGIFAFSNKQGYFFNLQYKDKIVSHIMGFLDRNQIGFYPNLENFENSIVNKIVDFKVMEIPNRNQFNFNTDLLSKSISISIKALEFYKIESIVEKMNMSNLQFKLSNAYEENFYQKKENNIHFIKIIDGKKIVFSIKGNKYFPGINFDTYQEFVSYIEMLIEMRKEEVSEEVEKFLNLILGEATNINDFILKNPNFDFVDSNDVVDLIFSFNIFEKLKENFQEMELSVYSDGKYYYAYFLDQEKLGIKIYLNIEQIDLNKKYIISIQDYISQKDRITGALSKLAASQIGTYIPCIVKDATKGEGIIFDNLVATISLEEGRLLAGEKIYIKLKNDEGLGEYKIHKDTENLYYNSINDLLSLIENKDFIENISIKELSVLLEEIIKKSSLINYKVPNFVYEISAYADNGRKIGTFVVDNNHFAQGSFGEVYKGMDIVTKKQIIIKRFTSNKIENPEYKKFVNEAKILLESDIAIIPKAYKFYEETREYVADFVQGTTLREYYKQMNSLLIEEKFAYLKTQFIKIAEALDKLHGKGYIHCDIKPENIMYDAYNDEIKIIDLGSVHSENQKGGLGTLKYSSPEQCYIYANKHLEEGTEHVFDCRSDIYSYGVMLYEAFVGSAPYDDSLEESTLIKAHLLGREDKGTEYSFKNPREVNEDVPEEIEEIILKAMETEKENRYNDFFDLIMDLEG